MKRKRQAQETEEDLQGNTARTRARPRSTAKARASEVNGHHTLQSTPRRRRSSINSEGGSVGELPGAIFADEGDSFGAAEDRAAFDAEVNSPGVSDIDDLGSSGDELSNEKFKSTRTPRGKSRLAKGRTLFSTPVTKGGNQKLHGTPRIERNLDRSARRKSTKNMIERAVLGTTSDNDEEEEDLAQQIYASEDDELARNDEANFAGELSEAVFAPETPTKRGRGRPKGSKNKQRSPTPPQDLPPHELYFFQNRGGRSKTSNNNLSSIALLDHEEYFNLLREYKDPHAEDIYHLESLHGESFNQWQFELEQDFNICIYGWGCKRHLLMKFAHHVYDSQAVDSKSKIVVVNGYVRNLTIRDVLNAVAAAISNRSHKLGSQPAEMLENVLALLEEDPAQEITLIIHSIDRPPLRRPTTQTILSRLSAHRQIHLVASADHHSFPMLWDSSMRSTYNFLFHDCTTFRPFTVEIDVVEEVHELLGRSGRRVGGREGVSFVLKSLPENAKNLFRVLVGEQLAVMDDDRGLGFGGHDEDDDDEDENGARTGKQRAANVGIEYGLLYQKAVEEFICSNEMNFRTLLKEFHDHQMIESRKDALGTEILSVPFRKEELEAILTDIVS